LWIFAQIPTESWRAHADYSSAKGLEIIENKVYCFTTNGLFFYNKSNNQYTTLTKLDGLSDSEISQIRYDNSSKTLLIAYQNGNLDFATLKDGIIEKIQNVDLIKVASSIQNSKRINQIEFRNQMVYLAADFGLVEFDIQKFEIKNTLQTPNVQAVTFARDSIFINTSNGILGTRFASNNNIQFIGNWKQIIDNQLFKTPSFPTIPLVVSPIEIATDAENKIWIADEVNGLVSNFDGNFKTFNPNGIKGFIEELYYQDSKIYAIGERVNVFENNVWHLAANAPNLTKNITDSNGYLWQIVSRGVRVTDPKTNRNRTFSTGRGAGNLPNSTVNTIALDRDGLIWIGTNDGVAVVAASENIFSTTSEAYTPIYQRRRLLLQENIRTIAVDGGNRKWIGTTNGLFVFNASADELIEQFTTDNSPIPSNGIIDLAINNHGEVFVLTDKGLVSYQSDSSEPNEDFSNIRVFPNPVRPEFNGVLTILGLMENSTIKITDSAGRIMHEAKSNGGSATWDLQYQGRAVQTGIYLIFSVSSDGLERSIGKVAVVR
jgi:ligand-binding sensor domain-containing protein